LKYKRKGSGSKPFGERASEAGSFSGTSSSGRSSIESNPACVGAPIWIRALELRV
jgi:hypothetical protein